MSEVKTYAVNCNDAWLNTDGDDISESYVKYSDYKALATRLDIAERACAALAAENAGLNYKMNKLLVWPGIEFYSSAWEFCNIDGNDALEFMCDKETPATDAFLAEIERKAISRFINSIEHILRDRLSPYDTGEMLEAMRIFLEEQGAKQ
ncbi:hypothetical protein V2H33_22165 [Escherichia coli]|uniref:hypothetical protein n=1 Tax=Escherichia coli TaxID=562 RepID=UPI002EAFD52C|nr:hypothetical protein [Escherichia coli]